MLRSAGIDVSSTDAGEDGLGRAAIVNSRTLLDKALRDERYRAARNRKPPRKLGTHLWLWDCLSCSKCIPACPNDAVFEIEVEPFIGEMPVLAIDGTAWREAGRRLYRALKPTQIAIFADACNDCGNCDVFCPEDGGPHIEKPRFFGSVASWQRAAPLTGFVLTKEAGAFVLRGRMTEGEVALSHVPGSREALFDACNAMVVVDWVSHEVLSVRQPESVIPPLAVARGGPEPAEALNPEPRAPTDLSVYLTLRLLLGALLTGPRVNFVNAPFVE
jgi:ferredoxin